MLTRTGSLKLANLATGTSTPLGSEKLDDPMPWRFSSIGFANHGSVGLALDQRGKLFVVRLIPHPKGTM